MRLSLRFSIFLAMILVAGITIGTTVLIVGAITRAEFNRYVEYGRTLREDRLEHTVLMWAGEPDQLPNVEDMQYLRYLTEDVAIDPGNYRFRPMGTVGIMEAVPSESGLQFEAIEGNAATILRDGESIGTFYVDPITDDDLQPGQTAFMTSLDALLLLAAGLAGLFAFIVTALLSRRILQPVASLTQAVQRMEQGDLGQRVTVDGQNEIRELAMAFNAMAAALDQNEQTRRQMVSDIAHELRTPLTNIRGYLEGIFDEVIIPDRPTLDLIYGETMLLNQLVQDLQELSLADAGALRLILEPTDLRVPIRQAVDALLPSAAKKDIVIQQYIEDALPLINADEHRLAQILRNLLSNAIRYSDPQTAVTIRATAEPRGVSIAVSDEGCGITADDLAHIFERFYRVDPSRTRTTGGAGLGLAIVKQLVEAHNGQITVHSQPGEGSTFVVSMPAYQYDASGPDNAANGPSRRATRSRISESAARTSISSVESSASA